MKNLVASFFFAVFALTAMAQQSTQPDARLNAKFSAKELKAMQAEKPDAISFWNYYVDHGYTIMEMPQGKGEDLPVVNIADENSFNLLELNIEPQDEGNRYFRIAESGKLLAVHSWSEVKLHFNNKK